MYRILPSMVSNWSMIYLIIKLVSLKYNKFKVNFDNDW